MNVLGLEANWGSAYFMYLRREMKLWKSWETGLQSQEMQSQQAETNKKYRPP